MAKNKTTISIPFFDMFKYAFVGGSIWGEILGGIIGLVLVILKIKDEWKLKPNS